MKKLMKPIRRMHLDVEGGLRPTTVLNNQDNEKNRNISPAVPKRKKKYPRVTDNYTPINGLELQKDERITKTWFSKPGSGLVFQEITSPTQSFIVSITENSMGRTFIYWNKDTFYRIGKKAPCDRKIYRSFIDLVRIDPNDAPINQDNHFLGIFSKLW